MGGGNSMAVRRPLMLVRVPLLVTAVTDDSFSSFFSLSCVERRALDSDGWLCKERGQPSDVGERQLGVARKRLIVIPMFTPSLVV
jgi:hypothetical protein